MKLALNTKATAKYNIDPQTSFAPSTTSRRRAGLRIGKKWAEFQGLNNWAGMLDPLDPSLRAEILRYGRFVQAAYTCFDCDPSSPSYATCRFPKHSLLPDSGLPSTGYRVTRNLHASSGAPLPKWVEQHGPSWAVRRSSWIGYVAVCTDEDEIARLGRRDVVIAYRGTGTCMEWVENLRATLTHLPPSATSIGSSPDPMVERGFWSLFASSGLSYASLRDQVREEVGRLMNTYGGWRNKQPMSITITGHSLGAALAVLTAHDIRATLKDSPMVTVVSFGGPRVGNSSFRRRLEEQGSKVLRIVNTRDIITKVPGFVVNQEAASGDDEEQQEEEERERDIPGWLLSKTGWVYADIGQELRVSSRRTADVVACHDLDVYLNLVNQLSATCPLRAKVKESCRWRPPSNVQQQMN